MRIAKTAILLGAIFGLLGRDALAGNVGGPVGTVIHLYTYTDYGTGDVQIIVQNPPSTCPGGFWIRMTDAGAHSVLAEVMMAVAQQRSMSMWGFDDQLWAGSTAATCRVFAADIS